jgi:L-lysine exporter family protein LysE/ArgO
MHAFFTGFFLGLSLIVAIGAQNSFVLRQGILGKHVFFVALFCSISDAILIIIGVSGISFFIDHLDTEINRLVYIIAATWLTGYGLLRFKACLSKNVLLEIEKSLSKNLLSTIAVAAILTFANPHVYLDTMILIGTISQQFSGDTIYFYVLGACLASFIFFFALAYGAKLIAPTMQKPFSWRILDGSISIIMFTLAFNLFFQAMQLK